MPVTQTQPVISALPPKIEIVSGMQGWVALVLAVTHHTEVAAYDLLRRTGRTGYILSDARRLLVWAFLEVADADDQGAVAWLEQVLPINKRNILAILKEKEPENLRDVIDTYSGLYALIGFDELREAIAAGLFGQRGQRVRVWPKGFTQSLGLRDM